MKYKLKPRTVEAYKLEPVPSEVIKTLIDLGKAKMIPEGLSLMTPTGWMPVYMGDYIISMGDAHIPMAEKMFELAYEPLEEEEEDGREDTGKEIS